MKTAKPILHGVGTRSLTLYFHAIPWILLRDELFRERCPRCYTHLFKHYPKIEILNPLQQALNPGCESSSYQDSQVLRDKL